MEARMFDEIMVGLAALKAEIEAINARPLPRRDLKNAYAQLGIKPQRTRKRVTKAKVSKPKA